MIGNKKGTKKNLNINGHILARTNNKEQKIVETEVVFKLVFWGEKERNVWLLIFLNK